MSDLDCPTTDPAQFAKCKCGHTAKGTKYCDIEGGDDEWLEAYSLVRFTLFYLTDSSSPTLSAATIAILPKASENAMTTCISRTGGAQKRKQSFMWT